MSCDLCRELLAEGLDLCVRARGLDARDRRECTLAASVDPQGWVESGQFDRHVARHNIERPEAPIATRSATVRLWEQDQYDTDLAAWEAKARKHMMQGCTFSPLTPEHQP
jgi:hypothetical protein